MDLKVVATIYVQKSSIVAFELIRKALKIVIFKGNLKMALLMLSKHHD